MHLVQIFLPLRDNDRQPFPRRLYDDLRTELTERYGGVTAYLRAPASGAWKDDDGDVVHDDLVVYEVMCEDLDREWWNAFRERVRTTFRQEELIVRATAIELL